MNSIFRTMLSLARIGLLCWDSWCSHYSCTGRISCLLIFLTWFRLELMDISLIVNIRSNLTHLHCLQLLLLLPYLIEITFFVFTSMINLLKFRQASDCCKRVLEAAKFAYAKKSNNKKRVSYPTNLGLETFGELLTVFSTKVNLLYLLYSSAWRCCLLLLIKQKCLLKTFLRTLILMT